VPARIPDELDQHEDPEQAHGSDQGEQEQREEPLEKSRYRDHLPIVTEPDSTPAASPPMSTCRDMLGRMEGRVNDDEQDTTSENGNGPADSDAEAKGPERAPRPARGSGDDVAYESEWYEVLKRRAEEEDEEDEADDQA
jgi:hypothetical protein